MLFGFTKFKGWFFSEKWGYYQKTNERVVCYIQRRLGDGFILQLYKRGQMSMCDLEYRSHDIEELIFTADQWLDEFAEGDLTQIHKHYYSPHNPQGYWSIEYPNIKEKS